MERLVQAGKIEEVYFARLLPGEDILNAIYQICKEHDIKTGVILDGSGAGVDFTYQHFPFNKSFIDPRLNVVVATMEGKCEMSLQGTIGTTVVKLPHHPRISGDCGGQVAHAGLHGRRWHTLCPRPLHRQQ